MGKIKSFVARHKIKVVTSIVAAFMACVSAVSCFAAEEGTAEAALKQSFTTGVSGISETILGYLAIVVPIALGIVVAYIAIKKGISFMRSLIGR